MPKGYKRRPFSWIWVVTYQCHTMTGNFTASKHRYKVDADEEAWRLMKKYAKLKSVSVTRRMVREGW